MTALLNTTETIVGRLLVLGSVFLLALQIFICLQAQWQHQPKRMVWLHLLHSVFGLCLTACLLDGIYRLPNPAIPYTRIAPVVHRLFSLPWGIILAAELVSAVLIVLSYRNNLRYAKSHLLLSSIKEAVDLLPAGICFGDKKGTVVLANLKINEHCRSITGERLTDTDAFWHELTVSGEDQNGQKLVKTASGVVLLFMKNDIAVDGEIYTQILSSDITEQYRMTVELSDKNEKLKDIQLRMKAYQVKAADMVISREIQNARRIVHDDVGHALLAARYYFEHPENGNEAVLLSLMQHTNDMLLKETEQPDDMAHDRYLDALKMADAIGVIVDQNGEAPEAGAAREILGQAIWECAANTAKHDEGDRLFVTVKETESDYSFIVTNNGEPPKESIIETGGLLSLRHIVEESGGTMAIMSVPAFRLSITLPKE